MQARAAPRDAFSGPRGVKLNRLADIDGIRAHFNHGVMGSRAVFNVFGRRNYNPAQIIGNRGVSKLAKPSSRFIEYQPHHRAMGAWS